MKYLKIPKERVGILIGSNGETKKMIEKFSKTTLEIDSVEGEVAIVEHKTSNPVLILIVENVIKAIGRGFSPEQAIRLFNEDMDFFIFNLHDYVSKKRTHIIRIKSRIIGTDGKTKRTIENVTGANLSIYGHTVAIITDFESMDITTKAIDMILSGSKHAKVYTHVEREMKKLRLGKKIILDDY